MKIGLLIPGIALFLGGTFCVSSSYAQEILDCRPLNASGSQLRVETAVLPGLQYTIESSPDLKSWNRVHDLIAGTGESQTFSLNVPAGKSNACRLRTVIPDYAMSWDVGGLVPGVGIVQVDRAGTYTLIELTESLPDQQMRRGAGLFFHDRIADTRMLLRISPEGYPSEVYIGNSLLYRFTVTDLSGRKVSIQAFDNTGAVAGQPLGVVAGSEFFGISSGPRGTVTSLDKHKPPTPQHPLITYAKGVVNFASLALAIRPGDEWFAALAALAGPLSAAFDNGQDFGKLGNGTLWVFNTAQCAAAIIAVRTGTALLPPPVSVPLWFQYSAFLSSAGLACYDSLYGIAEFIKTSITPDMTPVARMEAAHAEFQRLLLTWGSPYISYRGQYLEQVYERRSEFFLAVNRTLSMLQFSESVMRQHGGEFTPAQHSTATERIRVRQIQLRASLASPRSDAVAWLGPTESAVESLERSIANNPPTDPARAYGLLASYTGSRDALRGIVASIDSIAESLPDR